MDEKLRNRLKNALKKAGLSEGLVDSYEGLDDSALETIISGLESTAQPPAPDMEDIVASAAFTNWINAGGFDKLLAKNKAAQSQFDSKMSKGFQKRLQNFLKGDEDDSQEDAPANVTGASETEKALLKMVQTLTAEVKGLKEARSTESKLDQAKSLIGKSKLPQAIQEKWIGRIDLNSETDLAEQIKGLEAEYSEIAGVTGEETGGNEQPGYQFDQSRKKTSGKELSTADKSSLAAFAKSVKI